MQQLPVKLHSFKTYFVDLRNENDESESAESMEVTTSPVNHH